MNRTKQIVINRRSFYIDEEAHTLLSSYLKDLEKHYAHLDYGKEIIEDIEARISELLSQRLNSEVYVVTSERIKEVIKTIGRPQEIDGEEDKEEQTANNDSTASSPQNQTSKRFYRDYNDKKIAGVCAGIAHYINIDETIVRIIAALLIIPTAGYIILVYIVLWILTPPALTTAQILEMRGENVTVKNIQNNLEEEFEKLRERFRSRKK